MADTNTNGNGWKIPAIIAGTLAGIWLLVGLIKGELDPRKWFAPATPPAPEKNDFEKCVEANKAKPDNEPCSNCVAEGSGQPSYNGVIRNGECVRQAQPATTYIILKKIKVKAAGGAIVYSYVGGNFVALVNAAKIPLDTVLTILQTATSNGITYFNTAMGWIIATDADAIS